MGFVNAEITLKNVNDVTATKLGLLKDQEIRQETVTAMVDTGAITLVINEKLRQKLGLDIVGEHPARLANHQTEIVKIADLVNVRWKNRDMNCNPLVISGEGNTLLGAIPLEFMDLMVDPTRNELVGAHGDEIISIIM